LATIDKIADFALEKCPKLNRSAYKTKFIEASKSIEYHQGTLLSNTAVNLSSTVNKQLDVLMGYLEAFNSAVEEIRSHSELNMTLHLFEGNMATIALKDGTKVSLKTLAGKIADLLPACFLECLPGTKEHTEKLKVWRLDYSTEQKSTSPLAAYIAKAAEDFLLKSQDFAHPIIFLLKNLDIEYIPPGRSPQSRPGSITPAFKDAIAGPPSVADKDIEFPKFDDDNGAPAANPV
jgi:hypothetical protein